MAKKENKKENKKEEKKVKAGENYEDYSDYLAAQSDSLAEKKV